MSPRLSPYLRLEARRSLIHAALPAVTLALLVALGSAGHSDATSRHQIWTVALVVLLPLAWGFAANRVTRWRRGEGEWLGSSPASPLALLTASWAGSLLASLVALLAIGAMATLGTTGTTATRLVRSADTPQMIRVAAGSSHRFLLEGLEQAQSLRLRVMPVAGGESPTTHCSVTLARPSEQHSATARVFSRTWIEVDLPRGTGPLRVTVTNDGDGDLALLSGRSIELWAAAADSRWVSLDLVLRALLALAAGLALAIGLGSWLPTGSATGLLLVLGLWSTGLVSTDVFRLGAALDAAAEGRLPRAIGLLPVAISFTLIAIGLLLGRLGIHGKRADG